MTDKCNKYLYQYKIIKHIKMNTAMRIYRTIQLKYTNHNNIKVLLTKIYNTNEAQTVKTHSTISRVYSKLLNSFERRTTLLLITVSSATVYAVFKLKLCQIVTAVSNKPKQVTVTVANREKRFIRFASVEYNNQLYMTPKDFLRSIIEAEPTNPNRIRRVLTQNEMEEIQRNTPSTKKASKMLFRNLKHNGIISYSEYLFLRSILTKPSTGFKIAFDMLDRNCNRDIDKEEFLVMEKVFSTTLKDKQRIQDIDIISANLHFVNDDIGLQRIHDVNTTLQIYFFGFNGNKKLSYKDFERFMVNLQLEALEMEFNQYARGFPTITEHDFATILFRYTKLASDEYHVYSNRLKERLIESHGIPFEDFYVFFQFLNCLEDFATALWMYTSAGFAISEHEFQRAVRVCTGASLNTDLVHTVFCLFDEDGDGILSHGEFTMIMKDRLQRGSHSAASYSDGFTRFKKCVKKEIRKR